MSEQTVYANPANPEVFGEDVGQLAWEAVGVGVAAFGSDRVVFPIARNVLPGASVGTAGKLVDAASTGVTGWLAGELVGRLNTAVGRRIRRGGVLLGVAKVISAFVPGFSISASIPAPASFPVFAAPQAPKALPANGNGVVRLETRLGVGSMGL